MNINNLTPEPNTAQTRAAYHKNAITAIVRFVDNIPHLEIDGVLYSAPYTTDISRLVNYITPSKLNDNRPHGYVCVYVYHEDTSFHITTKYWTYLIDKSKVKVYKDGNTYKVDIARLNTKMARIYKSQF